MAKAYQGANISLDFWQKYDIVLENQGSMLQCEWKV